MKIDMENVFIGTINICTRYKINTTLSFGKHIGGNVYEGGLPYKKNAILLKVTQSGYVDLDTLNSLLDEIKVKSQIYKDGSFNTNGLILSSVPNGLNSKFVDESTLIPYNSLEQIKKPTAKKLKKAILMDVRIPGGIEH